MLVATSFPKAIQVCVGEALLFCLCIWHFMATGIVSKFDASHHSVVVLLGLGAILVLPPVRMQCVIWRSWAYISTAKGSFARITTSDSHQLAGSKMVLSRDPVVQKRWSCEVVGRDQFSQGDPGLCWGSFAFLIVDLTFHAQWHICQVRRQPSCRGSFAWLWSHPSLATRTDATVEVLLATCHRCSSKLCWSFGLFGPSSLQQRQLRKNHNFGTATRVQIMQRKYRWSCEVVGSDQSSQRDPGLCWGSSAFLFVDLTFHGHWHSFQVRCQPSLSGSLAWLGSHPSLATRKDATVEVVLATCHRCSSKLCWSFGLFGPHLYRKGSSVRITTLAQLVG